VKKNNYKMRNLVQYLRFEVLRAVKMSMLVFGVVTLCGLVGEYRWFERNIRGFSPGGGGSMFLRNVGIYLQVHMTSPSTRQQRIDLVLLR
jgi:hypothetical protein